MAAFFQISAIGSGFIQIDTSSRSPVKVGRRADVGAERRVPLGVDDSLRQR